MKHALLFGLILFSLVGYADTPAPGTVKAKTYSGDGNTAVTTTGTALDVHLTSSSGNLVNQGVAGTDPWYVSVRNSAPLPVNACKETGGNLEAILAALGGTLLVDGSGHTQPVSGTFWQATQPVSAASLPLPSGAATAVKQPALGTAGTPSNDVITVQGHSGMTPITVDNTGSITTVNQGEPGPSASPWPVILESGSTTTVSGTVTANAGTGTFSVDGSGFTQPVSGTFWQATQPVSGTITANAGSGTFAVDASGFTVPVSGTFWQATQPVSGTFWQATQPVSGTVTANIGTSGSLALDSTVAGLQVSQGSTTSGQSGSLALGAVSTAAPSYTTAQSNALSLTTAGALRTDGSATTQPVSGTFWQATQPVSGTVTANAGSGTFTVSGTVTANAGTGTFTVDGSGHTQPVSGTFWQATQPVSLTTLPALTAGSAIIGKVGIDQTTPGTTNLVALAANQSVNVAQINGVTPLMGNGGTGTGSQRVTIASDNTAFSVNATPVVPAALTVKQAAITIGTSAVRLTTDGSAPSSTRVLLVAQLLSTSTAACYLGSSGVTSSSTGRGVQMFAGQTYSFTKDAGDYYAICDASSQTFFITEQE